METQKQLTKQQVTVLDVHVNFACRQITSYKNTITDRCHQWQG